MNLTRTEQEIHDEVIIETDARHSLSLEEVCENMGRTPSWAHGLLLQADSCECQYYQKD